MAKDEINWDEVTIQGIGSPADPAEGAVIAGLPEASTEGDGLAPVDAAVAMAGTQEDESLERQRRETEARISETVAPFLDEAEKDLYTFLVRLKKQKPDIDKYGFLGGDEITDAEFNAFDHRLKVLAGQAKKAQDALAARGLTGGVPFFRKYASLLPAFAAEALKSVAREADQVFKRPEFYEYWNNALHNPGLLVEEGSRFPDENSVREQAEQFLRGAESAQANFESGEERRRERKATLAKLIEWIK